MVAQVFLAFLPLTDAGLFVQSLRNLKTLNPGFNVRKVPAFDVNPTMAFMVARGTRRSAFE